MKKHTDQTRLPYNYKLIFRTTHNRKQEYGILRKDAQAKNTPYFLIINVKDFVNKKQIRNFTAEKKFTQ